MKNKLNKKQLSEIAFIFFGGIFNIPVSGIICLITINILSNIGIDTNILIGSTVINSTKHQVDYGPLMIMISYILGMGFAYLHMIKLNKQKVIRNLLTFL